MLHRHSRHIYSSVKRVERFRGGVERSWSHALLFCSRPWSLGRRCASRSHMWSGALRVGRKRCQNSSPTEKKLRNLQWGSVRKISERTRYFQKRRMRQRTRIFMRNSDPNWRCWNSMDKWRNFRRSWGTGEGERETQWRDFTVLQTVFPLERASLIPAVCMVHVLKYWPSNEVTQSTCSFVLYNNAQWYYILIQDNGEGRFCLLCWQACKYKWCRLL